MSLYTAFDVWKRYGNDSAIRYRCFQILNSNKFCVQSADFYRLPLDDRQARVIDNQFIQLLIEEAPDKRARCFDSIEEAILAHDREFENRNL